MKILTAKKLEIRESVIDTLNYANIDGNMLFVLNSAMHYFPDDKERQIDLIACITEIFILTEKFGYPRQVFPRWIAQQVFFEWDLLDVLEKEIQMFNSGKKAYFIGDKPKT